MEIDQYAFCPCGSGKKFKWCCQNIYHDIERAYKQLEEGQVDTGLRIMHEVTQAHAGNPEAWGRQAEVLLHAGKTEEAEAALNRAFELNPNYPFGLLTRARLLADEGEFTGALILARRAAEAYHPEALDYLAQVYGMIYQLEMRRNRPVAAHAALRILVRCQPGDQELRDVLNATFGPESFLPACARENYTFLHPSGELSVERRRAWDLVLKQLETPQLSTLAAAFEQLTQQDASDGPAWFNLAVANAWLGENRKAIDAVERYLPLETDPERAALAAALSMVLVCGAGLENESDWKQHIVEYRAHEMQPLITMLQEWNERGRLIIRNTEEEGMLTAMVLEDVAPAIVTSESPATPDRRLGGYIVAAPPALRLWGPNEEAFNRLREEVKTKGGAGLAEGPLQVGPTTFGDVVAPALLFPAVKGMEQEKARQVILENARKYFEEAWVNQPLKALAGNTPLDAAGHGVLRKKLQGVIQFMADCARVGILKEYDFTGLRHKLGLGGAPSSTSTPASRDFSAMNTPELAALSVETLSDEELEKAYQTARKLDAGEVAAKFGGALVARPIPSGQSRDRYPFFSFLLQRSLREGDHDAALDLVNEGEKQDCEFNEGRRRNDYELQRAEVYVKRREPDQAHDVFTRLIDRSPENMKYRGQAAQGMLSLGQTSRAVQFAEAGVAEAQRQNNRDAEAQMLELLEDAKRRSK